MIHPDDLKLALDNFQKHCDDKNHPMISMFAIKNQMPKAGLGFDAEAW